MGMEVRPLPGRVPALRGVMSSPPRPRRQGPFSAGSSCSARGQEGNELRRPRVQVRNPGQLAHKVRGACVPSPSRHSPERWVFLGVMG